MSKSVITAKHIDKTYGTVKAVCSLSFEVEEFTCFGFLGPNGAGKTTIMRMLYGGVVRDTQPKSEVRVFGYDPRDSELPIKYLSGVVPQENNLDRELSLQQNLLVFAKFYNIPRTEAEKRIEKLLNFMELTDKKYAKIKELSGGMQRRLTIARALLNNPKLLILDEPTTGLDPQVRQLIWDKIHKLKREGVTILLTTHYMEEAFQLCDKIIIMHNGEKVMEGNPKKLLEENIEKYVLEIIKQDSLTLPENLVCNVHIRKDEAHERILFYSNDFGCLKNMTQSLPQKDHYLRESNLEDLFLKTTGRGLNE